MTPEEPRRPHVAVIGGGIAGLAAAWELVRSADAPRVTVLEGSAHCGGKLAVGEIAGVSVDEGAEQVLLRRPEAVTLLAELGLADQLVHPATSAAGVLVERRLRPLPPRTLLGVPTDLRALRRSRVIGAAAVARARLEPLVPGRAPSEDVAVGPYLRSRLGAPVVDRLVEPLLGGVYAGRADLLSLAATMPQLWSALQGRRSVIRAAQSVLPVNGRGAPEPVFGSLPGGLAHLVRPLLEALAAAGAQVRTSAVVREIVRTPDGWRITVGPTRTPERIDADAVVVAVPGRPASRLLGGLGEPGLSGAAARLGGVDYASIALVTLAFDRLALRGSGFLVPPAEGRAVKAATFTSVKWGRPGASVVRLSYGRHGEEADLQREDAELVRLAVSDLAEITGATGGLLDARVVRWGGGLPQYAPGHLDLVASLRAALAGLPTLAVAGAAYDGVGVPACIGSGRAAARSVLAGLGRLGD